MQRVKIKNKNVFANSRQTCNNQKSNTFVSCTIFDIEIEANNFFNSNSSSNFFRHNRASIKICSNFIIDVCNR